jgi:hypothetical protein
MLFEIGNENAGRKSHCGVLEFIADEGVVYMPHWVSSPHRTHLHSCLPPPSRTGLLCHPPSLIPHSLAPRNAQRGGVIS